MNESELNRALVEASCASGDRASRAAAVAAVIRRFGSDRWVGLCDVGRKQTSLLGWDGPGPPGHPRFPRRDGLCGVPVGLIDVESEQSEAFDEPDERLLERCAALIWPLWRLAGDDQAGARAATEEVAG